MENNKKNKLDSNKISYNSFADPCECLFTGEKKILLIDR